MRIVTGRMLVGSLLVLGPLAACSGTDTPSIAGGVDASSSDASSDGSASSSGGSSSGGSSSGSAGGPCHTCSVAQDCNVCGATPQYGYFWCCSNSGCFQWSTAVCPTQSGGGSSSSSSGGRDGGGPG
jgi:hypothetical protein